MIKQLLHGLEDNASELVLLDITLPEWVEILEVLSEAKPVQLGHLAKLKKDFFDVLRDSLSLPSPSLDLVLYNGHIAKIVRLGVLEELQVQHLAFILVIRGVQFADGPVLFLLEVEAKGSQHLPKLLRADLKPVELIPVLEEVLGVKPVN